VSDLCSLCVLCVNVCAVVVYVFLSCSSVLCYGVLCLLLLVSCMIRCFALVVSLCVVLFVRMLFVFCVCVCLRLSFCLMVGDLVVVIA